MLENSKKKISAGIYAMHARFLAKLLIILAVLTWNVEMSTSAFNETKSSEVLCGVGILSKASHAKQRMVLRETWFKFPSVLNGTFVPRFFVAVPSKYTILEKLYSERDKFGDIEICSNVTEGYDNLPSQTFESLRYFTTKIRAHYILKVLARRLCSHTSHRPHPSVQRAPPHT